MATPLLHRKMRTVKDQAALAMGLTAIFGLLFAKAVLALGVLV